MLPKLTDAGWDTEPRSFTEQKTFTDGRIVASGNKIRRRPQKQADSLLRHTGLAPATVERFPGPNEERKSPGARGWPIALAIMHECGADSVLVPRKALESAEKKGRRRRV